MGWLVQNLKKMHIGLIDVDGHNFPNLPLMKLSAYHKQHGDTVEWWDGFASYDRIYMSKVFDNMYSPDVLEPVNAKEIVKGGTGYGLKNKLTDEVEHIMPDYSLYPSLTGWGKPLKQQTAFGFLTRGCPRGCEFCIVGEKEGLCSCRVANLSEFWSGQGKIKLLDPNLLACPDHMSLLEQLSLSRAWVDFTQGLDARMINEKNAEALAKVKTKMIHFALDDMPQIDAVCRGLETYSRAVGGVNYRRARVYILTNFNTTHEEDMERIKRVQSLGYWPYVMIYNKPTAPKITRDLQRWSNNAIIYNAQPNFNLYRRCRA